jgi:HEAT repeat protein
MKTILISLLSLAPVAHSAVPVQDVLAKLPAPSIEEGAALLQKLSAEGPAVVLEVARRIKPSDVDPTPAPRFALQGLTALYGRADTPAATRAAYAKALLQATSETPSPEIRVLLLQDLRRVAGDESVQGLAPYLASPDTYFTASAVLQSVNTPAAHAALVDGLARAPNPRAVETVLSALANSGPAAGREAALTRLTDPTRDIRIAAAQVLSRAADPADRAALRKAVDAAADKYERSRQLWALLDFAARLGTSPEAAAIAREVLSAETDSAFRSGALTVLMGSGADASAELKQALAGEDIELREAAVKALRNVPGESVTAFILAGINEAPDAAQKASAVGMLEGRRDASTQAALRALMRDAHPEVRVAAIGVAGRTFGGDMLADFIFLLGVNTPEETDAMAAEILRMPGDNVVPMIASAMSSRKPAGRAAILGILEERKAVAQRQAVFAATKDDDTKVRKAAQKALAAVATPDDVAALVEILGRTAGSPESIGVKRALMNVGPANPEAFAAAISARMSGVENAAKADLLDALACVGGKTALDVVGRSLADPALKEAAVKALSRWPDAAALPMLSTAAAGNDKIAVLAVRGAAELIRKSSLPEAGKLAALQELRKSSPGDAAAAPVQAVLSSLRLPAAAAEAAAALTAPATRDAAQQAVLAIALDESGALRARDPVLIDALTRVLRHSQDRDLAKKILAAVKPVSATGGNLAAGRPTSASIGSEGGNTPDKAVDGSTNNDTGWWGVGHEGHRWWQVDLGPDTTFSQVRVFFHADGTRYYQYTLNVSDDGATWREIQNAAGNTTPSTSDGALHRFPPVTARYLRVWVHKNSANPSTHLREVQVFASEPVEAAPAADADGFVPMLRGKFAGWTGDHSGYYFNGESLVATRLAGGTPFTTRESYSDFHLKFDFLLTPHANNGVILFGNGACEVQILDDTHPEYATLKPYQYHGSVYGVMPATRGSLKPLGEWNSEEIIVKDRNIEVIVNGRTIVKGNLDDALAEAVKTGDGNAHIAAYLNNKYGPIGFLGHGEHVEFRNISIKNLKSDAWRPLFNGKDLTGWRALVGNPETRKGMTPEQIQAEAVKLGDKVAKHWWVENGEIVTDGKGENLCTDRYYGDFEMTVDWKILPNGDSGIYIRGCPQVQIWDPTNREQWKHGSDRGSGGLWNNTREGRIPMVKADKPAGEWNAMRIRMRGDQVSIWLNDQLVVDEATLENYWAREKPIQPAEQIELQAHGNEVRFRNLRIREL